MKCMLYFFAGHNPNGFFCRFLKHLCGRVDADRDQPHLCEAPVRGACPAANIEHENTALKGHAGHLQTENASLKSHIENIERVIEKTGAHRLYHWGSKIKDTLRRQR